MRLALSSLFAFSVLLTAPLHAQEAPADTARLAADDCARARALGKTCVLTIGAEEIEGGVRRPEGDVIDAPRFGSAASLIRLRRDFIPEILGSAHLIP